MQDRPQMKLSLQVIPSSITILAYCSEDASPTCLCQEERQPGHRQPPPRCPAEQKRDPRPASQTRAWLGTHDYQYFPEVFPNEALGTPGKTAKRNHSMVGVGRDLCGSPTPTPCRSRVTYSRLHRTLSRWVLNISREGDSTIEILSDSRILRVYSK